MTTDLRPMSDTILPVQLHNDVIVLFKAFDTT
jgi:hypothetical protein